VDLNPDDIWAAHAVTHVYQMLSRFSDGTNWLESLLPRWGSANNFLFHMHWHHALCRLGRREYEAALAIYDDNLATALDDDFYLDVCNAASLLWRLELRGVDVGERWARLNACSTPRVTDRELLFSTLHYLMTPARLGDERTLEVARETFKRWAAEDTTQGALCRRVGLPLAEAIIELGRGQRETAASILAEVEADIPLIGGSHAQRELFSEFRRTTR